MHTFWKIIATLGLMLPTMSLFAQGSEDSRDVSGVIETVFESRIQSILEPYLKRGSFSVEASVIASDTQEKQTPYLTYPVLPGALQKMSSQKLMQMISNVDIKVVLFKKYDEPTSGYLESMVRRKLKIPDNAPAKISIESTIVNFDSVAQDNLTQSGSAASSQGASTENLQEIREADRKTAEAKRKEELMRQEKDKIQRERDDRALDAQSAKDNLSKLTDELNQLRFGLTNEVLVRKNIPIGLAILAAVFCAILLGSLLSRAFSKMSKAVGSVAQALGEQEGKGGGEISAAQQPERLSDQSSGHRNDDKAASGYQTTASLDVLWGQVDNMRKDLASRLEETGIAAVINYVSDLVAKEQSAEAVIALESFGEDRANQIYRALRKDCQNNVLKAMKEAVYDKPKPIALLEAGEKMRSLLMAALLHDRREYLREDVELKILETSDEDIIRIAKILDGDDLTRFFHYLDPLRIAKIMAALAGEGKDGLARKAKLLLRLAETQSEKDRDDGIIKTIDAIKKERPAHDKKPYFQFYEEIVSSMEEGVADLVVDALCEADQEVKVFLRQKFVSYSQFFGIGRELRERILDDLSNRQLAALLALTEANLIPAIREALSERRLASIDSELQRIANDTAREKEAKYKEAKAKVLLGIKANLAEITAKGPATPAPTTNPRPLQTQGAA